MADAGRAELCGTKHALRELAVRLEHVGSTAVPGLAAKPIIDLQLSVDGIQPRERYVQPLKRLGYLFVPSPESPGLHELRHIGVRDFLRTHADEAARYAALKRHVATRHPQDRLAYIEGKDEYVTALEARAVALARHLCDHRPVPGSPCDPRAGQCARFAVGSADADQRARKSAR